MALTVDQRSAVRRLVEASLDDAEGVWDKHGEAVNKALFEYATDAAMVRKAEKVPSRIPGHDTVDSDRPKVDDFIALVADMRDSSQHLLCRIAGTKDDVTELKRVYFETAALLPAIELTISYQRGKVTEYLGDGLLALFAAPKDALDDAIRAAFRAADNCVCDTRNIVNKVLAERYLLPSLNLGVGLGYSPALVQTVGLEGISHAKAIGRCVFHASKLSKGTNEVWVDKALDYAWPRSDGGKLKFSPKKHSGVDGFVVSRSTAN